MSSRHEISVKNPDYHYIRQPKGMSDTMYERRCIDPFCSIWPGDDMQEWRDYLRTISEKGLAESQSDGRDIEASEFATDLAYTEFFNGGDNMVTYADIAIATLDKAKAVEIDDTTSLQVLKAKAAIIDITELQSFSDTLNMLPTLEGKDRRNALQVREAQLQSAILEGVRLLEETATALSTTHDPDMRSELVGFMFELLFLTNRRRQIYADETYDEHMTIRSTAMQDQATVVYTPKRHSFDILEVDATRQTSALIQCKASKTQHSQTTGAPVDRKMYDDSIEPVSGVAFGMFIAAPDEYIRIIKALTSNNPNIPDEYFQRAQRKMDGLFDRTSLSTIGAAGDLALQNS
jgi:hypothetical protein